MTAPLLQHTLKKKLHRLQRMIAAPQKLARHEERLHNLRVGLKEWRAALCLLQGMAPDFPATDVSERFRPVFHSAGGVRFWQLQRSFLNRSGAQLQPFAGHYRAHIRARLGQARRAFQAAAKVRWPEWRGRPGSWMCRPRGRRSCVIASLRSAVPWHGRTQHLVHGFHRP